jgi:hypothetical protein
MPWSTFEHNTLHASTVDPPPFLNTYFQEFAEGLRMLELRTNFHSAKRPSLLALVFQTSQSSSSDPRDKIFALLGLLSEDERASLDPRLPDYETSQVELF